MTDHLRPTEPIAARAVLPGDPGRALALAQGLLDRPRMANHARGLWGYTARTPAGTELTVQATGIGGPSIAIVLEELAALGVERAIRIGTCEALVPGLAPGSLVAAAAAFAPSHDGHLPPAPDPDRDLTAALLSGVNRPTAATVASTDRYYDPDAETKRETWREAGASVVDLGTAATLEVGSRVGMAVASALVVVRGTHGPRLSDDQVEAASLRLGRLASVALCR